MVENLDWKSIFGGLLVIIIMIVLQLHTKRPVPDGDEAYAKYFKDNFQCNLILEEVDANNATLTGIDVLSKKEVTIKDPTKWTMFKYGESKIHIGDTLIKEKGKYDIIVKSKKGIKILPMVLGDKTLSNINKTTN